MVTFEDEKGRREEIRPREEIKASEKVSGSVSAPKEKWIADVFAVDWPVGGEESYFAEDMRAATLSALEKWGKVTGLRITTIANNIQEGEGMVRPRVLSLSRAIEWFQKNDYFTYDEAQGIFHPTEKWKGLFQKVQMSE